MLIMLNMMFFLSLFCISCLRWDIGNKRSVHEQWRGSGPHMQRVTDNGPPRVCTLVSSGQYHQLLRQARSLGKKSWHSFNTKILCSNKYIDSILHFILIYMSIQHYFFKLIYNVGLFLIFVRLLWGMEEKAHAC